MVVAAAAEAVAVDEVDLQVEATDGLLTAHLRTATTTRAQVDTAHHRCAAGKHTGHLFIARSREANLHIGIVEATEVVVHAATGHIERRWRL